MIGIYFFIFFHMEVCCEISLESPHRGDSNEYTQYTIFNIEKIILSYPKSAAVGFFQGTQERVRDSSGKRAISVRVTEVLLYGWIDRQMYGWMICNFTSSVLNSIPVISGRWAVCNGTPFTVAMISPPGPLGQ